MKLRDSRAVVSVGAFVVTLVVLASDAWQSSADLHAYGADKEALLAQLAAKEVEVGGLHSALGSVRQLKLSNTVCQTACDMSQRLVHKPHLRTKIELKECHGQKRSSVCCVCIDEGFDFHSAAGTADSADPDPVAVLESQLDTAHLAVVENLDRAAFDRVAVEDAEQKLRDAERKIDSLNAQLRSSSRGGGGLVAAKVEVDDLDPSSYPIVCEAAAPKQLFYDRIGKASSMTVMAALKSAARQNSYSVKEMITAEYLTKEGYLELMQKVVGAGLGCVTSSCSRTVFIAHVFFMDLADFLPADKFTRPAYINWLRDPTERYISQYFFWRTLGDIGPSTSRVGASLEQCAEKSHLYGCPPLNYMTSYLCGNDPVCSDPPDEQTYLHAKRNLMTQYAMVGLTEEMDRSMKLLQKTFPTWFKSPPPSRMSANKNSNKKGVSAATKAMVEKANSFDRRLYNDAKVIFERRAKLCGV